MGKLKKLIEKSWQFVKNRIEESILVVSIIFLIVGLFLDLKCMIKTPLNNMEDMSWLLSIQTSIVVLPIAIVALLSGIISESYMGVKKIAYYLHIKPRIFTQKRIIFMEFLLLIISVCMNMCHFNNLIFSCLIIELLIILYNIFGIFEAYYGNIEVENEIIEYLEKEADLNKECESHISALISDWVKISSKQLLDEFKDYFKIFFMFNLAIMLKEKDTKKANSNAEKVAKALLTSNSNDCKLKGIIFVNLYYDCFVYVIRDNDSQLFENLSGRVELLYNVNSEYYKAIDYVGLEKFENLDKSLFSLIPNVIGLAYYINFNEQEKNQEIDSLKALMRSLGYLLNRQDKKGIIYNSKYWKELIVQYQSNSIYLPCKELRRSADKNFADCIIELIFGYITNGYIDYVKESLFINKIGNTDFVNDDIYVYEIMTIHCMLYWIAYRESEDYIDNNLKNKVKELLNDKKVIKAINNFYRVVSRNYGVMDKNLRIEISDTLMKYEYFFIQNGITGDIVNDYYLYVVMKFSLYKKDPEKVLDAKCYGRLLSYDDQRELKERLIEIDELFNEVGADSSDVVEEILENFSNVMKKIYKPYLIEQSKNKEKYFVDMQYGERFIKGLSECLDIKVKNSLSIVSEVSNVQEKIEKHENEMYIKVPIDIINDDCPGISLKSYIDECVTKNKFKIFEDIKNELKTVGIEVINRDIKFESDNAYLEWLGSNGYNTLWGCKYEFDPSDYMHEKEFALKLEDFERKFIFGTSDGVVIKDNALSVKVSNFKVSLVPADVDKDGFSYKKVSDDKYIYEPIRGIRLEYSKDELRQYVAYTHKKAIIKYDIEICYSGKKDDVVIITRNN